MYKNIKGERALDVLADIMEPFVEIASDEEVVENLKKNKVLIAVKKVLKDYKPQVFTILASLEGKPVEEYKDTVTLLTVPVVLLRLFNDSDVVSLFFQSQELTAGATSSGPATENTAETETM